MNTQQKQMIRHAYGKTGWRTHYCTDVNEPDMLELVERGVFKEPIGHGMVGDGCAIFHLTDAGKIIARLLEHPTEGKGYGFIALGGKVHKTHRLSFEVFKGEIPSGAIVLHRCDNPPCVNPNHLEIGTHKDNVRDSIERKRHIAPKGSAHGNAVLSESKAKEIWLLFKSGTRQCELARMFGVKKCTINDIIKGRRWKHVTKNL